MYRGFRSINHIILLGMVVEEIVIEGKNAYFILQTKERGVNRLLYKVNHKVMLAVKLALVLKEHMKKYETVFVSGSLFSMKTDSGYVTEVRSQDIQIIHQNYKQDYESRKEKENYNV